MKKPWAGHPAIGYTSTGAGAGEYNVRRSAPIVNVVVSHYGLPARRPTLEPVNALEVLPRSPPSYQY